MHVFLSLVVSFGFENFLSHLFFSLSSLSLTVDPLSPFPDRPPFSKEESHHHHCYFPQLEKEKENQKKKILNQLYVCTCQFIICPRVLIVFIFYICHKNDVQLYFNPLSNNLNRSQLMAERVWYNSRKSYKLIKISPNLENFMIIFLKIIVKIMG